MAGGLFTDLSLASMLSSNDDGELNPGETISLTLYQTDDSAVSRQDVTVDGTTVAEDVKISGQTTRVQVPAPTLSDYSGDEVVRVGGERIEALGGLNVVPGRSETSPESLAEQGYVGGSNAASYVGDGATQSQPSETTSATNPEDSGPDPTETPGLVPADNQQGYRLAPTLEQYYASADAYLGDREDGTLDQLNSSSTSTSPASNSSSTASSGLSSQQMAAGAALAVAAAAYIYQQS